MPRVHVLWSQVVARRVDQVLIGRDVFGAHEVLSGVLAGNFPRRHVVANSCKRRVSHDGDAIL